MHAFQSSLPDDMKTPRPLPGVQPVVGPWLRIDEAYGAQMARRAAILQAHLPDAHAMGQSALNPCQELLDEVLKLLPGLGFLNVDGGILCPDKRCVELDWDRPLLTLGRLVQCDFCVLNKTGGEHVLEAAVLCFPASWRLSEKLGKPLVAIHEDIAEYTAPVATRTQRLFDGVQVGRPLWRCNQLLYADPELYQPRSDQAPRRVRPDAQEAGYLRAERQVILRLPKSKWVVFAIHTYVIPLSESGAGRP
jgi:hypothetical protein